MQREQQLAPEQRLARVFVELADTMVADFDVIEFLHLLTGRCTQLLGVDAAGILLTNQRDQLQLVAASSEQARLLELLQLQSEQGPCLDCFATGQPVTCTDLAGEADRWPKFAAATRGQGYRAVHALPMRLREQVIGALNLFSSAARGLDPASAALGQAFADIATIGILSERAVRENEILTQQLQSALNTRIIIEQAKGMFAERRGTSVDEAFTALRGHARRSNRKLSEVALEVIAHADAIPDLTEGGPAEQLP